MSEYRYYHFDRFRGAKQMAQGAIAQALTEEAALEKAKSWFSPWDSFKLTKITDSTPETGAEHG